MIDGNSRLDRISSRREQRPKTRREPRRLVALEGFGVLDDGATFSLSVIDLSYDGCKVDTEVALLPGVNLKISVPGRGIATATSVRWYKHGQAGLKFNPEDPPDKSQTPRKHERVNLDAELSIKRASRPHYRTHLFDLTTAGCKVEFVERPISGETVWVKFDGLTALESTVRWIEGFSVGLEFTRRIYPAVLDLLLARLSICSTSRLPTDDL